MKVIRVAWALLFWLATFASACAHTTSDSYLRLRVLDRTVEGTWSLALHDLEYAIGLDANEDGAITWGELKAHKDAVLEYARSRFDLEWDGQRSGLRFVPDLQVEQLAQGGFAVVQFSASGREEPSALTVNYRAFFDGNPLHRGLILVEQGEVSQQAICSPTEQRIRFEMAAPRPGREFVRFIGEGIWHIGIGYDHILFLLALLLPSVLHYQAGRWVSVDDLRGASLNVLKVITAFTLAHSVTLSLASLEIIRLPSRWVESVIAASIVVAALNNVWPVVTRKTWGLALAFGLVHGFGFASVLQDLGLRRSSLVRALVGFNLGVELGRLIIVALFLPLAFLARKNRAYQRAFLPWGSLVVAVLAGWWMIERLRG